MARYAIRFGIALASLLVPPLAPLLAADRPAPDFFAAAVCEPPYSVAEATALYEAAEKLGKPDTSSLGAAIYHLPTPISRDGFTTREVVFAGSAIGVLIDGNVADSLAAQYRLAPEKSHVMGTSTKGFARLLPDAQQAMKGLGLISIVAREGAAMKDKTLLACELVSDEDRMAMEAFEKGGK
ncbi:hypothetical protein AWL63_13615 [Sphingomonas panacis]|uniref:Uncharacterized protein n=1 Tax=Sphingomonas panacis TaxID=1560345 RepID=A0A1B3ZBN9_9SPHN|nr:hypothetical protein [Sphingomonas panacis]AOH84848.1 hypothetical protein AWL63_13615 [Sphingomonas panacis]